MKSYTVQICVRILESDRTYTDTYIQPYEDIQADTYEEAHSIAIERAKSETNIDKELVFFVNAWSENK